MLATKPRLRIVGHGRRLRVRLKGHWERDASGALRESCRASVAVEKAIAEAIHVARRTGMSWGEIARTVGAAEQVSDKAALIDAFVDQRRAILEYQLRRFT